jgi:PAS domain S-box-containing protein
MKNEPRQPDTRVLETMLEFAVDAALTFSDDGRITSCNPGFENLFGYPSSEAIGMPVESVLAGLTVALCQPSVANPAASADDDGCAASAAEFHARGRRKDGSSFAAHVRVRSILDAGQASYAAVVWASPLADERRFESQEMLRAVSYSTTAVIFIKGIDGRYLFVNRRFEDLFHVRNEWLRGKNDFDFMPEEVARNLRANDREVALRGAPLEFDELVPRDGEMREYISIKVPLVRSSGEVYAICGIATDITERRQTEQRQRETYEQLEAVVYSRASDATEGEERTREQFAQRAWLFREMSNLVAAAHEGIWALNVDGITRFANVRMAEMLGCTVDELLGRHFLDFVPQMRREEAERYLESRLQGLEDERDFELRRKDGAAVWTLASTSPVRDTEGRIVGTLGMFMDITRRKHAEEQQQRLLRELDHRVKNSLATVNALAELTMRKVESLDEFRKSFGARIQALARTHEALALAHWGDIDVADLLSLVLAAPMGLCPGQIELTGPPVRIPARMATALALTVSELDANALKYGALSPGGGAINVEWTCDSGDVLRLRWRERHARNGAPVREGTGSKLMYGLIEYELGGQLQLEHRADELLCSITVPLGCERDPATAIAAGAGGGVS